MAAKKKKPSIFDPIKPQGGTAGRQNKNIRTQLDEFGNPITAPPKPKSKKPARKKARRTKR